MDGIGTPTHFLKLYKGLSATDVSEDSATVFVASRETGACAIHSKLTLKWGEKGAKNKKKRKK